MRLIRKPVFWLFQIPLSLALWALILFFLAGCAAHPSLYAEAAVAYRIDDYTDWYQRSDRGWQCDDPWEFHLELGKEFKHNIRVGLHHESQIFCGTGFNDKPELYKNDIRISKKWGGK